MAQNTDHRRYGKQPRPPSLRCNPEATNQSLHEVPEKGLLLVESELPAPRPHGLEKK